MLDNIASQFLQNPTIENAKNILRYTRTNNMESLGMIFVDFLYKQFPYSLEIKEECAINSFNNKKYDIAFDILESVLAMKGLDEKTAFRLLFNQHFSINHVADRYIYYNIEKINSIKLRPKSELPMITLTITTCKRFDLFQKTMNSLINCFDIDMIDHWVCVDDNSSNEDRIQMKNLYPFFTFILKDESDKGHPRSMNIIKNYVKTPYLFHLEDDWKFFTQRSYIKDALDVINSDSRIGQCLINKNYTEIESDISIKGGFYKVSKGGVRYFEHEYVYTDEQKTDWYNKYGNCSSSNYWPHFSLRPSLIRTDIFKNIGDFNENAPHFEMEYAYRYFSLNYISVFFEGLYSIHTGRLTSEKHDDTKINAYKLNNQEQFVKKSKPLSPIDETSEIDISELGINLKTYVLNLDRRPDRWEKFISKSKCLEFLNFERYSAVDGEELVSTPQLQRIFDGNDYNMKVGAVGCAMSHFKMYIELMYSDYDAFLILEDDIEITDNFDVKLLHICNQLKNEEWDLLFLGHHLRNKNPQENKCKMNTLPVIEKWDVYTSFQNSVGGTIGYIISKKGAKNILDFINNNRLINCIDTLLQKCCNKLDIYYSNPHLIFSECYRNDTVAENFDTDIQHNFKSLTVSLLQKVKDELDFYDANDIKVSSLIYDEINLNDISISTEIYYYIGTNINVSTLRNQCNINKIRYYTFDEAVIFIVPEPVNVDRYFHIFKKDDMYTIDDCFAV